MHVCLMSNSIIAFCVILAVACISIYDAFYVIDYECMNELNLGDSRWICSSIVHQKCDHSFHSSETQCFETKKLQSTIHSEGKAQIMKRKRNFYLIFWHILGRCTKLWVNLKKNQNVIFATMYHRIWSQITKYYDKIATFWQPYQ